jgi:hypothetical protein
VLVDGEGNILKLWAGAVSEETLVKALEAALAGKPVPSSLFRNSIKHYPHLSEGYEE